MEHHPAARGDETMRNAWKLPNADPYGSQQYKDIKFLTPEQIAKFRKDGLLVIKAKDAWKEDELKQILSEVNKMDDWPEAPGKWMKYYEKKNPMPGEEPKPDAERAKILQRLEKFCDYAPELSKVIWTGSKLEHMASELFGEQAVMYKEKINYKLPGGEGFKPHQDVAAGWWMYGQSRHLSVLVAIDSATKENGALEVVYGYHDQGLLGEEWKEVPDEYVQKLEWHMVPTEPGDVVFFDSFVPHRSAPNFSQTRRRVMYITYAKHAEGDWREKYYEDKRKSFPPECERLPGVKYEYKI